MKMSSLLISFLAFVALGLFVTAVAAVSRVNAAIGFVGVPVKCVASANVAATVEAGCQAFDGTAFTSGTRVPPGYYLLVTDIVARPGGTATTGAWNFEIVGGPGYYYIPFSTQTRVTLSEHFTAPFLVLRAGEPVSLRNLSSSSGAVDVFISGLLTTDITYLPLVAR